MRVLHIGNIANNAYNNAKFLRRKGIDADALTYDYSHVMSQPEWEDAVFDGEVDEYYPDWSTVDLHGFRRPEWFHQIDVDRENRNQWAGRAKHFYGQFWLEWQLLRAKETARDAVRCLNLRWDFHRLVRHRQDQLAYRDIASLAPYVRYLGPFMKGYDIIQAYGLYEPKFVLLATPGTPLVAFEHGTMRDFPFENSDKGRWISLAYQKARKVVITNADSIVAARRMGLENVEFIPHPIDETKFRPQATPLSAELRNRYACDFVLFSPARQNWPLKGNDKVIRAFAHVLKRSTREAVLLLCAWGQETERSRKLIEELGIERRVAWLPPLNKMKLSLFYNAADVVLDQFTLGAFGTSTPEAMACGKPVLLYLNEEVHKWCFPEMPPVISAFTDAEIANRLMELLDASPEERRVLGLRGRAWVEHYHGWELVAEKHRRMYEEILN
jgi:glycosyltransferase involved in cell wall biosynthesis